ncbi:MAG: hypothetical protein K6E20_02670 [Acholeplasmatales bacterium]|nr:hypothetical protein [Acholeplasmatales bacterium]
MKKKTLYRKLIMSASAAAMTALCLTATTYAWFSRNDNVWLESTNVKMQWDDGILISLDGTNFSQDISSNQFKELIAGEAETYDNLAYDGCTLKLDENGNIQYDEAGNAIFEYDTVVREDVYKDVPVLDEDGNPVLDADNNPVTKQELDYTNYNHVSEVAKKNSEEDARYIQFDLYFRLSTEGSTSSSNFREKYNLVFGDLTKISAEDTSVKLKNKLTAYQNGEVTEYGSGDELSLNVANAMRLGVNSSDLGGLKVYETPTDLDLGSVALEGADETDPTHYKNYSAMYTYYNSLFPKYPLSEGKNKMVQTDNNYSDDSLGLFTYDYTEKKYNDLKVTFYMWLEGWDADYIYGVDAAGRDISVYLEFTYKETE